MTLGFLLTIAAGFIWSLVNVIDKTVVSKYIKDPIFMILIFTLVSFLVGVIAVPFVHGEITGLAWGWLFVAGLAHTFGTLLYFYAMKIEETSRVVPLFSLSTVFIVVLSAIFLGEVFDLITYIGIIVIIIGSVTIAARKNILQSFKSKALRLMIFSNLGFAIAYTVTKYLLNTYTYWQVFSWQRVMVGIFGVVLFIVLFKTVKKVYRKVKFKYMVLSGTAETMNVVGVFFFTMASAFWFVALVEAVVSVQYVFIFFWALIISRFKPSLFSEEVNKKIMLQKIVSIALIIVGIYLIT